MTTVTYDPSSNTLHLSSESLTATPWTDAMHKVYRFLCAPSNVDFFTEAWPVVGSLNKAECMAICVRAAFTPGVDMTANSKFFSEAYGRAVG